MSESYYFYWNGPFSQWHPSEFSLESLSYNCAEQYMMHQKAILFGDMDMAAKILEAKDPSEQKALGKSVKSFNEQVWHNEREQIVFDGNHAKFSQNKGPAQEAHSKLDDYYCLVEA